QRDHAKHPRAHALGERLDRPALARAVAAFEDDADLEPLLLHPLLQLHELDVQLLELLVVILARDLLRRSLRGLAVAAVLLLRVLALLLLHGGLLKGTWPPR